MPSATTVTKGVRGDFGWMFQLLSALMSALAIVALARHAFVTWSLTAPMTVVMDAYNATMQVLFGWAEPHLQSALTWLGSFIGWHPFLHQHWRDVFVVSALWNAGALRAARQANHPRWWAPVIIGLPCTAAGALLTGVLPLQSGLSTQLLIATIPIAAWFAPLLITGPLVWRRLRLPRKEMVWLAFPIVLTALPAAIVNALSLSSPYSGLGLVGLALSVIALGAIMCFSGNMRKDGAGPIQLTMGLTILGGFIGAFCFFAIDAGLKLVMG